MPKITEANDRMLPELTLETRAFWTGGANGELLITRCQTCRYWIHPPAPICRKCVSRDVVPEPVSGHAAVHSFTVNHQPFLPNVDVPFAIAIVELPEQDGLRLTTNIVDCQPCAVFIGMNVRVQFLRRDDVYLPLFAPVE